MPIPSICPRDSNRQAAASRPTQQAHQHRLGLIVKGMGGSDSVGRSLGQQFREPAVAKFASCSFQADLLLPRMSRSISHPFMYLQLKLSGERAHEQRVGIGLSAADPMMEVGHG